MLHTKNTTKQSKLHKPHRKSVIKPRERNLISGYRFFLFFQCYSLHNGRYRNYIQIFINIPRHGTS